MSPFKHVFAKTYRQQSMTPDLVSQGHNSREIANQPAPLGKTSQINHPTHNGEQKAVHPLKVADDPVEADAKAGFGEFLCCGGPFDTDAEEVAEESFEEVEGDAAEEEEEETGREEEVSRMVRGAEGEERKELTASI
jgi:hypothetical protein